MEILGVDIGGSGVKAAVVDTARGELLSERLRRPTPQPAEPGAVVAVIADLVSDLGWSGPVGCGFPGVVCRGRVLTAANLSEEWIGVDAAACIGAVCGDGPVAVINDADAAGLAEVRFGAGVDRSGVVLVITLGTGIGSALFLDGQLVPNTELGHAEVGGVAAEKRAAARVREEEDLSWKKWSKELDRVLACYELLVRPDLIVIGGGISKKHEKFLPRLERETEIVPAGMRNTAGIVGAALAAYRGPAA